MCISRRTYSDGDTGQIDEDITMSRKPGDTAFVLPIDKAVVFPLRPCNFSNVSVFANLALLCLSFSAFSPPRVY